jgi:hypothetical protein
MKRLTTTILIIVLLLVVLQTINKSDAPYIPVLWVLLNIVPVLYLIMAKAAKHNLVYILSYALLALATVLSAGYVLTSFQMESDQYLLTSFAWLVFAQLGVWGQYYFTRHRVPADALSLGIEFPAEKSASIRALLLNGRIEEAVEELTAGEELNQEQKVVVTNFAYRFSKVVEQQTLGLLTMEQVTVEKNKIVTGILRYV